MGVAGLKCELESMVERGHLLRMQRFVYAQVSDDYIELMHVN